MKIYTKRGDTGQTDLLSKRVDKADLRIAVNGAIDEAMAFILMCKHHVNDETIVHDLDQLHGFLFSTAHEIALDDEQQTVITADMVTWIEGRIDDLDKRLEPLTRFIRLDGNKTASWINLARVTVRRAERELITLNKERPLNPLTLGLINRISDYLFTLGRIVEMSH
ncbi:MAG: cob(I)yrinic acid a,c-diamide adenosyltransferase [Acholeplasmataceae bacterium]|nr:MAG: cob(I)yrinic acid a,c-diamide adenosyltransferase [Acholeplasmataceae bacterium]